MQNEYSYNLIKVVGITKEATKSNLYILAGNTSSTLILVIASTIIARLLEPSDYGLHSVALFPLSLMLLFTGFGINQVFIRYTAKFKSEKKRIHRRSHINTL